MPFSSAQFSHSVMSDSETNLKHVTLALSTGDRYKLDKNLRKCFASYKGLEKTISEGSKDHK